MVFSSFLSFFAIFLEFSVTGWRGAHQNDFFLFSLFLRLSKPILDWKEAKMVFSNFLNFFPIFFLIYYYRSVGTHRNDVFYFLSSWPFPTYFGLKRSYDSVFKFFEFFCFFFGILYFGSGRNTSERYFFLFSLFLGISEPILDWKEAMMVFYNFLNILANGILFWIFLLFFWNSLFRGG